MNDTAKTTTWKDDTMRRLAVIMYGEKRLAELDALPAPYTTESAIKEDEDAEREAARGIA